MDSIVLDLLELNDGTIACFTITGIYVMIKIHNNSLEITKSFPIALSPSLQERLFYLTTT